MVESRQSRTAATSGDRQANHPQMIQPRNHVKGPSVRAPESCTLASNCPPAHQRLAANQRPSPAPLESSIRQGPSNASHSLGLGMSRQQTPFVPSDFVGSPSGTRERRRRTAHEPKHASTVSRIDEHPRACVFIAGVRVPFILFRRAAEKVCMGPAIISIPAVAIEPAWVVATETWCPDRRLRPLACVYKIVDRRVFVSGSRRSQNIGRALDQNGWPSQCRQTPSAHQERRRTSARWIHANHPSTIDGRNAEAPQECAHELRRKRARTVLAKHTIPIIRIASVLPNRHFATGVVNNEHTIENKPSDTRCFRETDC